MEAGEIVTVFGVKCSIRAILTPGDYGWTEEEKPHLVVLLDKVEEPKPDIRWERIPPSACMVCVTTQYVYFADRDGVNVGVFNDSVWKDWFFPNHSDFIGQTFERPKGGEA